MNKLFLVIFIYSTNFLFSQGNFNLEDLNPDSEFYGQQIGPSDFSGDICIVYFGHEY